MSYATITIDDQDYELASEGDWNIAQADIERIAQVGFGLLRLQSTEGELVVLLNHGSTLKYRLADGGKTTRD